MWNLPRFGKVRFPIYAVLLHSSRLDTVKVKDANPGTDAVGVLDHFCPIFRKPNLT